MSQLGLSVYCSNFLKVKERLQQLQVEGMYVFTSLHISEEFSETFNEDAMQMLSQLKEMKFKIICDVSQKTLNQFGYEDILLFQKDMGIDVLRIDYGFSIKECIDFAKQTKICMNASTLSFAQCKQLLEVNKDILFIHNFYPRVETGLDAQTFQSLNENLEKLNAEVVCFISGDEILRGPLYNGLVTLEKHRNVKPYVSYMDLVINYHIQHVWVADPLLSLQQYEWIMYYQQTKVMKIPVVFDKSYSNVLNTVFTIRKDSPMFLKRISESREYATQGNYIEPFNTVIRKRGSITMDNKKYARYSGEIMIACKDYIEDEKVNVIGVIQSQYFGLLDCLQNGMKIMFVQEG